MDPDAKWCTTFTLAAEPAAPRKRDEALKVSRNARKRSLVELGIGADADADAVEGEGAGAGAGAGAGGSTTAAVGRKYKKKAKEGAVTNPLLTAMDAALLPQKGPFFADV
jgi:hypothetical protein